MKAETYADVETYWQQLTDSVDTENGWMVEQKDEEGEWRYSYYEPGMLTKEMLLQEAADESIKALRVSNAGAVDYGKISMEDTLSSNTKICEITNDAEIADGIAELRERYQNGTRIFICAVFENTEPIDLDNYVMEFDQYSVDEMVAVIKEMTRFQDAAYIRVTIPPVFVAA